MRPQRNLEYGLTGTIALVLEHVFLSRSEVLPGALILCLALYLVHSYQESDQRSLIHAVVSGIGLAPAMFMYGSVAWILDNRERIRSSTTRILE